jgi:hypothetical protein
MWVELRTKDTILVKVSKVALFILVLVTKLVKDYIMENADARVVSGGRPHMHVFLLLLLFTGHVFLLCCLGAKHVSGSGRKCRKPVGIGRRCFTVVLALQRAGYRVPILLLVATVTRESCFIIAKDICGQSACDSRVTPF